MTILNTFIAQLRTAHDAGQLQFTQAKPDFAAFAKSVPEADRVELLLAVYDLYRGLACAMPGAVVHFESSTYSMLISALLDTKLKPTTAEACAILRRSYHHCGHGGDVETPLELAEKAFDQQPYTAELFDAVRDYQKVLKGTKSTTAQNVKRKLGWILWHDPNAIDKKCWMAHAQHSIAAMAAEERFAWEWLLRNTTATMSSSAGKAWLKEGEKRLAAVGADAFIARLDSWTRFPSEPVYLSPEGSCVLRLLIWYASALDPARVLPIVARIADVQWEKADPAKKVKGALAWLLDQHDDYRGIAQRLKQELEPVPVIANPQASGLSDRMAQLVGTFGSRLSGR